MKGELYRETLEETVTFVGSVGDVLSRGLRIFDWSIHLFFYRRNIKQNFIYRVQIKFDKSKLFQIRKNEHFLMNV